MKILQINTVCGSGSTGRISADLCRKITAMDEICFVAYGRGTHPDDINIFKIGTKIDQLYHGIMTRIFDDHGFYSKKATKNLIEFIKHFDPDIIHLHNIHGYFINIEILFKYLKESNKPVVWTLHDCWSFTGHCAYFEYAQCTKWMKGCFDCPQKEGYPSSKIFDNSRKNYTRKQELFNSVKNMTIVTPSYWLADRVKKSFLHSHPVRVINNGIQLDIFRPAVNREELKLKYGCLNKFVTLGVANIWEERKGLKFLYQIAERSDIDTQLIIVGLDERHKQQVPKNITIIPRTNNLEELAELYTMADVYINPTLDDNFPTTNIEALACGTPVITFDTGGSPEIIDEKCGIVVEKGNVNGILDAIQRIKEGAIQSTDCINRAHLYNKEAKYQEYLTLYKEIIKVL